MSRPISSIDFPESVFRIVRDPISRLIISARERKGGIRESRNFYPRSRVIPVSQITSRSILSFSIFHGFQWNGFNSAAQRGTGFTNEAADPCHCLAPFPSRFVIDRGRSTFLETRSLFRLSSARRERGRGAEMDLDVLSRPHLCTCTRPCVSIDRGGKGVLVELLDAASPLVIEAITTRRNKWPCSRGPIPHAPPPVQTAPLIKKPRIEKFEYHQLPPPGSEISRRRNGQSIEKVIEKVYPLIR